MIALRPATADDAEFLYLLARDSLGPYVEEIWGWDDDVQRDLQQRWLERGGVEIIEEKRRPIGCLKVTRHADHVFLDRVAFVPTAQRRGLGTRLVQKVMADAAVDGLSVRLSVLENNPARRLYERLGFRIIGIETPRIRMEWRPEADQAAR